MMKFTVNGKELKTMMEKVITAINKKATLTNLTRLYFQLDENGVLKVWGTNIDHYIEVRTGGVYQTSPGVVGIDNNDVKIISKMIGEITLEDISTETEMKINIRCGKKNVTIPKYENTDIFLPSMDGTEEKMLILKENWLLETITNLETYTSDNNVQKMMQVFNFNAKSKRIETLDGYRIGMRTLETQTICKVPENPFDTVKVHKICVPVLKKVLDKKSEREIVVTQDKKYIKAEGNDFTYIIHRVDGEYFKIEQMLNISTNFKFVADRENILGIMKYNADLVKMDGDDKIPVVLHSENGKLYSYVDTKKHEVFDEIDIKENDMSRDLYIGFDSKFLSDAFGIIDSDSPVCVGGGAKSPMIINGNEYSFLVLPVNIVGENYNEKIEKHINRGKVA